MQTRNHAPMPLRALALTAVLLLTATVLLAPAAAASSLQADPIAAVSVPPLPGPTRNCDIIRILTPDIPVGVGGRSVTTPGVGPYTVTWGAHTFVVHEPSKTYTVGPFIITTIPGQRICVDGP